MTLINPWLHPSPCGAEHLQLSIKDIYWGHLIHAKAPSAQASYHYCQGRNKYCHLTVKTALAFLIYSKHFLWQTTRFFTSELRLKTKSQQGHNSNLDWSRKMYWWIVCPLNCKSKHTRIFSDMTFAKKSYCLLCRLWHINFTEGMLRMEYWQCFAISTLKICTFLEWVDWRGGLLSNYRQ